MSFPRAKRDLKENDGIRLQPLKATAINLFNLSGDLRYSGWSSPALLAGLFHKKAAKYFCR